MVDPVERRAPVLIAAIALPPLLWGIVRCWPHTIDDGFIFLQYARNLVDGNGLVFNVGERIEGHSNTLWVLLLAAGGQWLGWTSWAKLLGAACAVAATVATGWLTAILLDHVVSDERPRLALLGGAAAALAISCHPGMAFYAVTGMGTALTMLLATVGIGLHAADLAEHRTPTSWWCYVPLGLLCLTRPEAPALLGVIAAQRIWLTPERQREVRRVAMAVLPLAALLAFRLAYYDALLPNTYAAKPSTMLSHPAGAWQYLVDSASSSGLLLTVVLITLAAMALGRARSRTVAAALLGPFAVQLLFTVYSGGDWMPHARFVLPAFPALAMAAAVALATSSRERWQLAAGAVTLATIVEGWGAAYFWSELDADHVHDHALRSQNNVAMAQWMAQNLEPGKTVLTDEIGAIGFYGGVEVIDMWGLVDRDVAALLSERGFNPYTSPTGTDQRREALDTVAKTLLARKPDYVTIDYRAPAPPPGANYDRRFFLPYTMRGLSRNMGDEYKLRHAFTLMKDPPKTFLLFAREP